MFRRGGNKMNEDQLIEWADKRREELEGVGLSDGLVLILRELYQKIHVRESLTQQTGEDQ
jgi:hypothetical protein